MSEPTPSKRSGRGCLTFLMLVAAVVIGTAWLIGVNDSGSTGTTVRSPIATTATPETVASPTTSRLPEPAPASTGSGKATPSGGKATLLALLEELTVAAEHSTEYDRGDYEHSRRYLCNTPGTDPYTGMRYEPATCDVDHIVAAKEAHDSGGHAWSGDTRRRFGNDPLNLVASRDCVNRSKGSSDPAEWSRVGSGTCAGASLTPAGRCFWTVRTVTVKHRYDLTVDSAEQTALRSGVGDCPDSVDISTPPRAAISTSPQTASTPSTVSGSVQSGTGACHPAYTPCLPDLPGDALNCGDLTSAQRPVRVKQPGVDPYRLDRDQDGKACE